MFMMDPPSAWELVVGGAMPGVVWLSIWAALSFFAARSESRGWLTACWIVACVLVFWIGLLLFSVPMLLIGAFWAPLGPLGFGVVSVRRLLALRDRGLFQW